MRNTSSYTRILGHVQSPGISWIFLDIFLHLHLSAFWYYAVRSCSLFILHCVKYFISGDFRYILNSNVSFFFFIFLVWVSTGASQIPLVLCSFQLFPQLFVYHSFVCLYVAFFLSACLVLPTLPNFSFCPPLSFSFIQIRVSCCH